MNAVVSVARAELRRRWRALIVLGFIAGVTGAVVTSGVTLARRTATAYPRLEQASNADDLRGMVLGRDQQESVEIGRRFAAIPGVGARVSEVGVARVEIDEIAYVGVVAAPTDAGEPLQPVVVSGRAPRPNAPGELLLLEDVARGGDIGVGDTFTLRFLVRDEYYSFDAGRPLAGRGPRVDIEIVGLVRAPGGVDELPPLFAGPGLSEAYPEAFAAGAALMLQVRDDAAAAAVEAETARIDAEVRLPAEAAEFRGMTLTTTAAVSSSASTTTNVIVAALAAFSIIAGLAGLIALVQASIRHHAVSGDEQGIEAALGLTRSERTAARALLAVVSGAVALLLTVAGGIVAGLFEPVGGTRFFEPNPGWSVNVVVTIGAALVVASLTVAVSALAASRAAIVARRRPHGLREVGFVRRIASLGGSPPLVLGLRFSLERGAGRSATPVASSIGGVILGVAGVVAVVVFTASLDRLVSTPLRFGWPTDFVVSDAGSDVVDALARDERLDVVVEGASGYVELDGRDYAAIGQEARRGELEWELLDGRPPATPDEVVLGTRVADDLDKGVGDVVTARSPTGEQPLTIVGVGVLPTYAGAGVGRNVALTMAGLERASLAEPFGEAGVSAEGGVDRDALSDELRTVYEINEVELPADVHNLSELGRIPDVLAAFLGLLALAVLGHSIVATSHRHRRDVALVRAMGLTPRQVRTTLAVMALATAGLGTVFGVPLGLALGRTVWRVVAEGAGVAGDSLAPTGTVVMLCAATVAAALLLAARPAWRATRSGPAATLRAE